MDPLARRPPTDLAYEGTIEGLVMAHPQLFIRQRKEWVEIVVDFETANLYEVLAPDQSSLGMVAERAGGFMDTIKRWLLRSHRPFDIDVTDPAGRTLLHLTRDFFWFFSDLDVVRPDGTRLGSVHRRFGILSKKYDLIGPDGQLFARIKSPFYRLWAFPVYGDDGQERGRIAKKWGGALREVFSDADSYMIDYSQHEWSAAERATLFAAAVSIDFDFFENNQGSGGLLDMLGD